MGNAFNSGRAALEEAEEERKDFIFHYPSSAQTCEPDGAKAGRTVLHQPDAARKDFRSRRRMVRKNHIVFERRRGKGISILYSEFNYRLALLNFYLEYKAEFYRPEAVRSSRMAAVDDFEYTALCNALDGFDVDSVAEAVAGLETRFGFRLSYTSNVTLLLLVSLCIIRQRKGKIAQVPQPPACKTDGLSDEMVTNVLIEDLQARFSLQIPRQECEFLFVRHCGQ